MAMNDPMKVGLFSRDKIGSINISHLFYVDGALFLGEWGWENIISIIRIVYTVCFWIATKSS